MTDDESVAKIEVELGNLQVKVKGDDIADVKDVFEDTWERRLDEAEDISKAVRDGNRSCL